MYWLSFLLALALLLALWRTLLWRPRPLPGVTRKPVWLIGHRGVRGRLPENTLRAFEAALEAGLDGLEFDVQQSRDGILVIHHDDALPDGQKIADLRFAELRERLPLLPELDDLFELATRYPGTLLNLEIKTKGVRTHGLEERVVRSVRRSGLAGRVLLSSFNPLSLARVRLKAPELRTALLYAPDLPRWLKHGQAAPWLHVDALHPHHAQVTATLMHRARQRNLPVNAWTVNEPTEVWRLLALDVNGLIADDPETLQNAVASAPSRSLNA
ncbi:MAG TPA: glycerophosphodiester phosphodiesterase, partial [Trueperaceae bacterium]